MTDLSGVSAQAILCPRDHWKLLLFPSLDGILVLMKSLPSGETWFSHNFEVALSRGCRYISFLYCRGKGLWSWYRSTRLSKNKKNCQISRTLSESAWVKEGPITFWCRLRSLFENNGIKGIDLVGNALSKCPSSLIILWSNHCAHGNCQSCGFFHPLQHQSCYFKSMLSKHKHDGAWTLYSYRLPKHCWLHVFQRILQ